MKRKAIIFFAIVVIILIGFLYLNWTMFGNRSSFQTGLANYQGIPKTASDITIYENRNISGTFLADFKIAESDFVAFASTNSWAIQPIANTEYVFQATAFNEKRPNDKKEITDGLYYSKRAANGGGITIAYDRKTGRGYIESSSR